MFKLVTTNTERFITNCSDKGMRDWCVSYCKCWVAAGGRLSTAKFTWVPIPYVGARSLTPTKVHAHESRNRSTVRKSQKRRSTHQSQDCS